MRRYFFIICSLIIASFLFVPFVSAHGDEEHEGMYEVTSSQTPPAPIVGKSTQIALRVRDKNGEIVSNLMGEIVVKKISVEQYVGVDPKLRYKVVYRAKATTDNDGEVRFSYTFTDDSEYDIEFAWGTAEDESVGEMIQPINPTSDKKVEDSVHDIALYSLVGLIGVGVGALAAFILLTTSLRRKK